MTMKAKLTISGRYQGITFVFDALSVEDFMKLLDEVSNLAEKYKGSISDKYEGPIEEAPNTQS